MWKIAPALTMVYSEGITPVHSLKEGALGTKFESPLCEVFIYAV